MEAFEAPPGAARGAQAQAAVAEPRGAGACFGAGRCHLDHAQAKTGQGQGDQSSGEPSANDDHRIRGQGAWIAHGQICSRKEPITCSNRGFTLDQRASFVLVARV